MHVLKYSIVTNHMVLLFVNEATTWYLFLIYRHAIDWIQEENILRVMVGQGGSIVCTLIIPSGYPLSGEVTLADIKGHSDADITDLKVKNMNSVEIQQSLKCVMSMNQSIHCL